MKKNLIIVFITLSIIFGSQLIFWVGPFLSLDLLKEAFTKKEIIVKENPYDIPKAEIQFYPVSEEAINFVSDCSDLSFLPEELRKSSFYCKNTYQTNGEQLLKEVSDSQVERVILYGLYSYYNCPTSSEKIPDVVKLCYEQANFLENWQFLKTIQLFGIDPPTDKVYFYVTDSYDQSKELCNPDKKRQALVCFYPQSNVIYLAQDMLVNERENKLVRALAFERKNDTKITYEMDFASPSGCPVSHTHELQHFFNSQIYGNAPSWFEESIVELVQEMVINNVCPPGVEYRNVKKVDGETRTKVDQFSLNLLNIEEPLSSRVEMFVDGNQCRRGIDMQIARFLEEQRESYLPKLFSSLRDGNLSSESGIAQAIWESSGKDENVKNFLFENDCVF